MNQVYQKYFSATRFLEVLGLISTAVRSVIQGLMYIVVHCIFQNTLYYDAWWVGQHVCLIWISTFVLFMVHFLPTRYIDVLHRCALHLGKWVKVEGRHAHVPYNA